MSDIFLRHNKHKSRYGEGGRAPGEWKAGGEGVLQTTVSASRLL